MMSAQHPCNCTLKLPSKRPPAQCSPHPAELRSPQVSKRSNDHLRQTIEPDGLVTPTDRSWATKIPLRDQSTVSPFRLPLMTSSSNASTCPRPHDGAHSALTSLAYFGSAGRRTRRPKRRVDLLGTETCPFRARAIPPTPTCPKSKLERALKTSPLALSQARLLLLRLYTRRRGRLLLLLMLSADPTEVIRDVAVV